jgi:hypothetical protein
MQVKGLECATFGTYQLCIRLKDFKIHVNRFCFQYSNSFIHEKELYLYMSFLAFLIKTNVLERE